MNRTPRPGSSTRFAGGFVVLSLVAAGLLVAGPSSAATTAPASPVTAASTVSTSAYCSSTPFRSSPANKRWFRIPAIVQTKAGTLVAFAERRDNNDASDTGNYDVVSARSTNHGCTWSAYKVIGSDAANRVSSPAPMVDSTTGNVLLFSVITPRAGSAGTGKGLYLQTSTDDGKTFSALLSHPVKATGSKGGLTGPGHGIQLTVTHPGRLIVPMGYKTTSGLYGAYGIYSDDHGATWKAGFDQQDTTGKVDFIEGTIAELPTGNLFISFRNRAATKAGTARKYAISTDGGASLNAAFKALPLKIVSVQGSALALSGAHSNELLFSAPADPTSNLRRDLTIFVSRTKGATWSKKYQVELESKPGAYSDLVQISGQAIGVLYETGTVTWKERIAFQAIKITDLTDPVLHASKVTYSRSKNATKTTAKAKVLVTVAVAGIKSPPGKVTLKAVRAGKSHSASVTLTYSNQGLRAITLPKLAKGDYKLTLTYSGTGRIKKATKAAGTLHVVA